MGKWGGGGNEGLINHWFSLVRPALKPLFLGRGTLVRGRLTSHDGWDETISLFFLEMGWDGFAKQDDCQDLVTGR